MPIDYKSPYSQQWSLDVQHQFGATWLADIGYYGSNGIHLPGFEDFTSPCRILFELHRGNSLRCGPCSNSRGPVVIAGPINGTTNSNKLAVLRPYVGYGPGLFFVDLFTANYHAANAVAEAFLRQLHGQRFLYLVARPDHRSRRPQHGGAALPQVTGDLRGNYGPTIADRRHVLTANFVWEIPWARNLHGVEGHC